MIHIKVYVVTSGSYSDYRIRRVFLDKDIAEKYKNMTFDSNDVEVYDTDDEMIRADDGIAIQYARLESRYAKNGLIYSEQVLCNDPRYYCKADIEYLIGNLFYSDTDFKDSTEIYNRYTTDSYFSRNIEKNKIGYVICIQRVYPKGKEKTADQLSKILYDIDAVVRAKLAEGFSIDEIAKLFEHYNAGGEANENV